MLVVRAARFGVGAAVAVVLFATASCWLYALGFDGRAVLAGEYWRLATCHLTHIDTRHALMNAVGAGLVTAVLLEFWRFATVFVSALAIAAIISAGSVLFFVETSFAGFSGILYGLAAMAVFGMAQRTPWLAATVAIVLLAGVVTALAGLNRPWAADVAVHTHVLGIAGGAGIGVWLRRRSPVGSGIDRS